MSVRFKNSQDMLSHGFYFRDSGILGCAEYELKMSNNDKEEFRRRLDHISFCSSCSFEAPRERELDLQQKVRILLKLLDEAKGDGEIVSLMSAAMGLIGGLSGSALFEWFVKTSNEGSPALEGNAIMLALCWIIAPCIILIIFSIGRMCSTRRRSALYGMLLILDYELENEREERSHTLNRQAVRGRLGKKILHQR